MRTSTSGDGWTGTCKADDGHPRHRVFGLRIMEQPGRMSRRPSEEWPVSPVSGPRYWTQVDAPRSRVGRRYFSVPHVPIGYRASPCLPATRSQQPASNHEFPGLGCVLAESGRSQTPRAPRPPSAESSPLSPLPPGIPARFPTPAATASPHVFRRYRLLRRALQLPALASGYVYMASPRADTTSASVSSGV